MHAPITKSLFSSPLLVGARVTWPLNGFMWHWNGFMWGLKWVHLTVVRYLENAPHFSGGPLRSDSRTCDFLRLCHVHPLSCRTLCYLALSCLFFCNVHLGLRQSPSSFRGIYSPCIEQAVFWTVWDMLYKDSEKMRIHILKSDLAVKLFLTLALSFATVPLHPYGCWVSFRNDQFGRHVGVTKCGPILAVRLGPQ